MIIDYWTVSPFGAEPSEKTTFDDEFEAIAHAKKMLQIMLKSATSCPVCLAVWHV